MNIWLAIADAGVFELMRLCGCEQKYMSGRASDFERFAELCRILPYLGENQEAADVTERIILALGGLIGRNNVCRESACALWKIYNEKYTEICLYENERILSAYDEKLYNELFVEAIKNGDEKNKFKSCVLHLNSLMVQVEFEEFFDILKCLKKEISRIYIDLYNGEFEPPNIYSAERVSKKIYNGEKCNNGENNLLLSQIICTLISQNKCRKMELYIDCNGNYTYAEKLIAYLSRYRLPARIFIAADLSCPPESVARVCRASTDICRATPKIFVGEGDSFDGTLEYAKRLARIYPLGYTLLADNGVPTSAEVGSWRCPENQQAFKKA
ncbi:MAG: hypothetical protein J6B72_01570 [Clostridia bacterium]|nr:hypothetical protein [Clostridia bacterium]